MSSYRRTAIRAFELANLAYVGASVAFYQVDAVLLTKLTTLATLYDSPSGIGQLPNPQTLDSSGKFIVPVYIEEPVIAVINATSLGSTQTGVLFPNALGYRKTWVSGLSYAPGDIVKDGAAGANTGNLYIANTAHTAGVWATDLNANLYWDLFLDYANLSVTAGNIIAAQNAATAAAASAAAAAVSAASVVNSTSTPNLLGTAGSPGVGTNPAAWDHAHGQGQQQERTVRRMRMACASGFM